MNTGAIGFGRGLPGGLIGGHDEEAARLRCVSRRTALSGLIGATFGLAVGPARAGGETEQIAAWFFERYLLQSINVAKFNAGRLSEDAGKAVETETPSLQRFLTKHRPAFVAALLPIIDAQLPAGETAAVAREVTSDQPAISARTREWLVAIDDEFQKSQQRLLRAMAYELNVLVEQIVINIRKTP